MSARPSRQGEPARVRRVNRYPRSNSLKIHYIGVISLEADSAHAHILKRRRVPVIGSRDMTPDERSLLTQFLTDLSKTQGVAKDPEAAQLIDQAIRSNADAAYVLTQHALLADQALHQAQQQIEALQAQIRQQPQPARPASGGFFGGAGLGPSVAQPRPASPAEAPWVQAQPQYSQNTYPPPPQPQAGGFFGGGPFSGQQSGLGSFLQSAGTTAAGVAGGAFLFEGLSNLFGGHHGMGGFGGGFGGGGGWGQSGENVTINNYGDSTSGDYDEEDIYDDDTGGSSDAGTDN